MPTTEWHCLPLLPHQFAHPVMNLPRSDVVPVGTRLLWWRFIHIWRFIRIGASPDHYRKPTRRLVASHRGLLKHPPARNHDLEALLQPKDDVQCIQAHAARCIYCPYSFVTHLSFVRYLRGPYRGRASLALHTGACLSKTPRISSSSQTPTPPLAIHPSLTTIPSRAP